MKYLFFFFFCLHCLNAFTEPTLSERSHLWPTFCHTTVELTIDDVHVPLGYRGVLLRLVGDEGSGALVDFGRKGVHVISTISTDILEQADRIEAGLESKRYPNLVELLSSRMIQVEAGDAKRLAQEDYMRIERMTCIRFPNTLDGWSDVAAWVREQRQGVGAPESILILFPEGGELSDTLVYEHLSAHGITDACYLYTFLAKSYQRLLWHGLETEDAAAWRLEFDAEGRMIEHQSLGSKGS